MCLKDHRCRIKAPAKPARLHIAGDVASREADGQKTGRECLERDFAHDPKPRGPQILPSQATIDADVSPFVRMRRPVGGPSDVTKPVIVSGTLVHGPGGNLTDWPGEDTGLDLSSRPSGIQPVSHNREFLALCAKEQAALRQIHARLAQLLRVSDNSGRGRTVSFNRR